MKYKEISQVNRNTQITRKYTFGTIRLLIIAVALVLSTTILGCSESDSNETTTIPTNPAPEFPLTITDQAGRQVTIQTKPQKIVSIAPSNTEIIYALGMENWLVGVTTYCDYPEAAKEKPKIGGYSTCDIEKMVAIQPDLILAGTIHIAEVVPALESYGMTVVVLNAITIDGTFEAIEMVGKCTGATDMANSLVSEMKSKIKVITDRIATLSQDQRKSVFFISYAEPSLMTVSPERIVYHLVELAGGINTFQNLTGYAPIVNLEEIIVANPQVIIAGVGMGLNEDIPLQWALNEERLRYVDAYINNCIYGIDFGLVGRPGPRIIKGLEQLAKMIYPEIFGPIE